jgi:PAS domain S-box-containing protein
MRRLHGVESLAATTPAIYRPRVDLRTRLVFALVLVALGSMLALGAFTYGSVRTMLEQTGLDQLDGLAESKKESVDKLFSGWHERVRLIASRTQLRRSVRDYGRSRDPVVVARIREILSDALNSVRTVEALEVFDGAGAPIVAVGRSPAATAGTTPSAPQPAADASEYRDLIFDESAAPRLVFVSNLMLNEQQVGVLRATIIGDELIDVIQNYEGLGETGETMIAVRDDAGAIQVLHPVRHERGVRLDPVPADDPDDPAVLALSGDLRPPASAIDYRGQPVRAAYRFLPQVGWGLVVKRDEAELQAPIVAFRGQLTQLGITLAAFAILAGTLLGLGLARPIQELVSVANRVRAGELDARATVRREDEIGLLARTFNDMATELERQVSELREFHTYFDLSLDMLCIAGMDGHFRKTNPAFERSLGWNAEQLRSKPFYEFVHPDDVEATRREVAKLAEGIPTIRFENRYLHADGTYRHLLWTAHPEPAEGLLYSAARDITELKELQAQATQQIRELERELEAAKARLRAEP